MQVISTGLGPLIVPVRDEAALRRAERIESACRRATERSGGECLYLFAVRDGDVIARMFDGDARRRRRPGDRRRRRAARRLPRVARTRGHAGRRGGRARRAGRPTELPAPGRPRGRGQWRVRVGGGVRIVGEGASGWPIRTLGRPAGLRDGSRIALVDLHGQHLGDPGSKGAELTYAAVSFRNVARPTSTGRCSGRATARCPGSSR